MRSTKMCQIPYAMWHATINIVKLYSFSHLPRELPSKVLNDTVTGFECSRNTRQSGRFQLNLKCYVAASRSINVRSIYTFIVRDIQIFGMMQKFAKPMLMLLWSPCR